MRLVLRELVVAAGRARVHEHVRAVARGEVGDPRPQRRVLLRIGVERRLGEHDEVVVAAQAVGEREVLLGEALVGLLRQRQLLVVALEHRDAEVPGGRRLEAGEVGRPPSPPRPRRCRSPRAPPPARCGSATRARGRGPARSRRRSRTSPARCRPRRRGPAPPGRRAGRRRGRPRGSRRAASGRRNASSTTHTAAVRNDDAEASTRERGDHAPVAATCAASTTSIGTKAT